MQDHAAQVVLQGPPERARSIGQALENTGSRGTLNAACTSDSVTVAEAGKLWIETGEENGLVRSSLTQNRQHLHLYIEPFLGSTRLSKGRYRSAGSWRARTHGCATTELNKRAGWLRTL
jgi:hypothetical protein